jgi:hypothetical protein
MPRTPTTTHAPSASDLLACIPADRWGHIDAERAAQLMGTLRQHPSRRMRQILRLPSDVIEQRLAPGAVLVGTAPDGSVVARMHHRPQHEGPRWMWRRFPRGTTPEQVMETARLQMSGTVGPTPVLVTGRPDGRAAEAPAPAPEPAPEPAPKPRRETLTTMGPDEFDALLSHVLSEADRRGLIYAPAPSRGLPAPTLADLTDPELRRQHADLAAELERRREALRARLAALG